MNDTNTTEALVPQVNINGTDFKLEPITIEGRTVKGVKKPDVTYFQPVLTDTTGVIAYVTALLLAADKVKAGSSKDLALGLLKDSHRQAMVDATKEDDDFLPVEWAKSMTTADRPRAHGEKLADLRQTAADLANDLITLYETSLKCGKDDAAIARETGGEYKTHTALQQARVAKTEKRRNITKLIEEKEQAKQKRQDEAAKKKAAAPAAAPAAPAPAQ